MDMRAHTVMASCLAGLLRHHAPGSSNSARGGSCHRTVSAAPGRTSLLLLCTAADRTSHRSANHLPYQMMDRSDRQGRMRFDSLRSALFSSAARSPAAPAVPPPPSGEPFMARVVPA